MLRTHFGGLVATNCDFLAFQLVKIQFGTLRPDDDLGMSQDCAGEEEDGGEDFFHEGERVRRLGGLQDYGIKGLKDYFSFCNIVIN